MSCRSEWQRTKASCESGCTARSHGSVQRGEWLKYLQHVRCLIIVLCAGADIDRQHDLAPAMQHIPEEVSHLQARAAALQTSCKRHGTSCECRLCDDRRDRVRRSCKTLLHVNCKSCRSIKQGLLLLVGKLGSELEDGLGAMGYITRVRAG